jgi:hypothetical protein
MEAAPTKLKEQTPRKKANEPVTERAIQQRAKALLSKARWLSYRPYIHPGLDLDNVIDQLMDFEDDFCWSSTQHPPYLARLIRSGFLCIGTDVGGGDHALLPKIHAERCLMKDLNNLVVSKGTRKKARRYQLTIDTAFDDVAAGCIEQHGYNWLGMVVDSLKQLHRRSMHGVEVHTIEVWKDGVLVAGEVGSTVGAVYTR